jgi:serine/threonine protein kinase
MKYYEMKRLKRLRTFAPHPIQSLGKYYILKSELIASGGEGKLYKCLKKECDVIETELHFNKIWQISTTKLLIKTIYTSKNKIAKLKKSVEMWEKVKSHDNILDLIDHFQINPKKYAVIIPYFKNLDLETYIENYSCLKEIEAKICFWQICQGVNYVHKKGFIHNDIKPGNILIGDKMEQFFLTDFSFIESDLKNLDHELPEFSNGTPLFMSPEKVSRVPYSYESDVWALGVTLFYLLFGQYPFYPPKNHFNILHLNKIICDMNSGFQFPKNIKVSHECKELILGCLQKCENHRWSLKQVLNCDWFKT